MAKKGRKRRNIRLPLAEVVSRVISEQVGPDGTLRDHDKAVKRGYSLLLEKERRALVERAIWLALKEAMKRGRDSAAEAGTIELPFPGLFAAYALDADGARLVKRTVKLTRLEFKQAMKIREDQLESDNESLQAMRRAYAALEPYWYPDQTFGEACDNYRAATAAA